MARIKGSSSHVLVSAGQQVIAEYNRGAAAGSPFARWVWGDYIDELVFRQQGSGNFWYFHRNQQYSIVAFTNSAGEVIERYAYTAYGQLTPMNHAGTPLAAPAFQYTYTGREWDHDTKLYYFRARWYDPALGRFASRDPLGYVDGMSLYKGYFVPRAVDPFGLTHKEAMPNNPCREGWTKASDSRDWAGGWRGVGRTRRHVAVDSAIFGYLEQWFELRAYYFDLGRDSIACGDTGVQKSLAYSYTISRSVTVGQQLQTTFNLGTVISALPITVSYARGSQVSTTESETITSTASMTQERERDIEVIIAQKRVDVVYTGILSNIFGSGIVETIDATINRREFATIVCTQPCNGSPEIPDGSGSTSEDGTCR